jgi:hypothetical protein
MPGGSEGGRPPVEGRFRWEWQVCQDVTYLQLLDWSVAALAVINAFCSAAQTSRTWHEELCSTSTSATMFLYALVVISSTHGTICCVSQWFSCVCLHVSFSKIHDKHRWNLVVVAYFKNSLENIILVAFYQVPRVKNAWSCTSAFPRRRPYVEGQLDNSIYLPSDWKRNISLSNWL